MELLNFNKNFNLKLTNTGTLADLETILGISFNGYLSMDNIMVQFAVIRDQQQYMTLSVNSTLTREDFQHLTTAFLNKTIAGDMLVINIQKM